MAVGILQETGVTQMGVQADLPPAFWIQVGECRLPESNVGQVHTWRFLCACLRAVGLLRGGGGGGEGGGGAAARRANGTHEEEQAPRSKLC